MFEQRDLNGYRSDIDGLRAVAVLPVVLFHAGIPGFEGGFVGVDVFFVISGFLITRLIIENRRSGRFTFAGFYERRARRLFPAFMTTLVLTVFSACLLFSTEHLERLGKSALYASFGVSNFMFWSEADYFDISSSFKPLLHTWSLAVEEQFYLLWPALLALLLSKAANKTTLRITFCGFAIASLVACEWFLARDPEMVFYLTPFRIYEFAFGALCVGAFTKGMSKPISELVVWAGIAAIGLSAIGFSKETRFPGVSSLIPCLGAVAIILAGRTSVSARYLLCNPLIVGIGRISYSLYLIHWPILVLFGYWNVISLNYTQKWLAIGASFAIAMVMYKWIETPFRQRSSSSFSGAAFGLGCAMITMAVAFTVANIWGFGGWEWRTEKDVQTLVTSKRQAQKQRQRAIRAGVCHLNGRDSRFEEYRAESCLSRDAATTFHVVTGDSHAADKYVGLARTFRETNFLQTTAAGCTPIVGKGGGRQRCEELKSFLIQNLAEDERVHGVILHARWQAEHLDGLERMVNLLSRKKPVVILGPTAEFNPAITTLAAGRRSLTNFDDFANQHIVVERFELNDAMQKRFSKLTGVQYVDLINLQCRKRHCNVFQKKVLQFIGAGHITVDGTVNLARKLKLQRPEWNSVYRSADNVLTKK